MLTNAETTELLIAAKNGDDIAKEKLITINSPLIKSIVKRYLNRGIDYEDLYQLGSLGFVKAINNFDASFNVKFTTYAVPMISGEIKRFLRDDGSVKVSRTIKYAANQIKNYVTQYVQKTGENPSIEKISKDLNIEINNVILAMEATITPLSLNDSLADDESQTILDKVTDDFSYEKFMDKLSIRELIKNLNSKEKQIIILRYYFDKTQTEVAKELGVSQVQISRIENKVLNELKDNLN